MGGLRTLVLLAIAILGSSGQAFAAENVTDEGCPLASCGEAAAWSLLKCLDIDAPLFDIHQQARRLNTTGDQLLLTIRDVRSILNHFGVATTAVQVTDNNVQRLSTPCVLFFPAGQWPLISSHQSGHYVTLVKFTGDEAVLFDWTGKVIDPAIHMPIRELSRVWSGQAIIPAESSPAQPFISWPTLWIGLCSVMVCALLLKHRRPAVAAMIVSVGMSMGCGSALEATAVPTEPLLTFSAPMARFGVVSSREKLEHEFPFRVASDEEVTITGFVTACGCTVPSQDLIGQPLAPGSDHILSVRVRPDGDGDVRTQMIQVMTEPESPFPIAVGVQFQVLEPPRVSVSELAVTVGPGEIPSAEIRITHRRALDAESIPFDRKRSRGENFDIESVDFTSEEILVNKASGHRMVIDTTRLTLRGRRSWPVGVHRGNLQLFLSDDTTYLIPTEIRVPHPLAPELQRVFCGVLTPGEAWSVTIPCRPSTDRFHLGSIDAAPLEVSASLTDSGDLELSGVAPNTRGRFEANVTIAFEPADVPALEIPISGLVR